MKIKNLLFCWLSLTVVFLNAGRGGVDDVAAEIAAAAKVAAPQAPSSLITQQDEAIQKIAEIVRVFRDEVMAQLQTLMARIDFQAGQFDKLENQIKALEAAVFGRSIDDQGTQKSEQPGVFSRVKDKVKKVFGSEASKK